MNLFPDLMLFDMTSGDDKFENELRVRVFADGILVLGSLMCLNKALAGIKRPKNTFLYILSLVLIFLTGFRMIDLACIIALFVMLKKFHLLKLKFLLMGSIVSLLLVTVALSTDLVQERIEEMKERNETDNFDNDDYVRVLLVTYYYTQYFNSNWEMFWGSGMVERQIMEGRDVPLRNADFKSEYSKDVSFLSNTYHYFPKDMGVIGLSWEAGIPAVLVLIILLFYMVFKLTDVRYSYIPTWCLYLILISSNNPRFYDYRNMIYFTMVLIIFEKVVRKDDALEISSMIKV